MEEMTSSIFILYTIFYLYLYSILYRKRMENHYSIDTEIFLSYEDVIMHLKENISAGETARTKEKCETGHLLFLCANL